MGIVQDGLVSQLVKGIRKGWAHGGSIMKQLAHESQQKLETLPVA